MTCKKCNFYYCWRCNNKLNDTHSEILCFIRVLCYISMILFNITVAFYYLGWLQYFVMIIGYPLYGFGLSLLYNSYIILPTAIIATSIYSFKHYPKVNGIRK